MLLLFLSERGGSAKPAPFFQPFISVDHIRRRPSSAQGKQTPLPSGRPRFRFDSKSQYDKTLSVVLLRRIANAARFIFFPGVFQADWDFAFAQKPAPFSMILRAGSGDENSIGSI